MLPSLCPVATATRLRKTGYIWVEKHIETPHQFQRLFYQKGPDRSMQIVVKPSKITRIYDTKLSVTENWTNADQLHFAWFAYCDPELHRRYRDSGQKAEHYVSTLKFEMRSDVRDLIANGQLSAIGIRIEQDGDAEPKIIPAILFAAESAEIDWDHCTLSALGQQFGEVRICLSMQAIEPIPVKVIDNQNTIKRGGGRPSQYNAAKPIITKLFRNKVFSSMKAAGLLERFNLDYLAAYSTPELKVSKISERTLRNYLIIYRKEPAEIGKN